MNDILTYEYTIHMECNITIYDFISILSSNNDPNIHINIEMLSYVKTI